MGRQDLVKLLYRLGRQGASGVLAIAGGGPRAPGARFPHNTNTCPPPSPFPREEIFVLRRGAVMCADGDVARRALVARLARLAALEHVSVAFEGGVSAYPPGAQSQLYLAGWARAHLEQQLDGALADLLVRELAGARLSVRADLAPEAQDEADRRMLLAMAHPRRLDQIWPLARTPRFRLLAFLHFLRAVDALDVVGVAAARAPRAIDPRRRAALHMLGVGEDANLDEVKRAYRRLARALHPDLQPDLDADRRRALERRFAEVTAAYETLV